MNTAVLLRSCPLRQRVDVETMSSYLMATRPIYVISLSRARASCSSRERLRHRSEKITRPRSDVRTQTSADDARQNRQASVRTQRDLFGRSVGTREEEMQIPTFSSIGLSLDRTASFRV